MTVYRAGLIGARKYPGLHYRIPRLATDCSGVRLAGYFVCKAIEESDMPWSYVQQDDGADCVSESLRPL